MVKQALKAKPKPAKKSDRTTAKPDLPKQAVAARKSTAAKTARQKSPTRKAGSTTSARATKRPKRGAMQRLGDFLKGLTRSAP